MSAAGATRRPGVAERTLQRGALRFTALEAGDGPLVLCLHGFPDRPETFRPQMEALATAGYRVVAPTMRGYEPGSQPPEGSYHLTALARDVLAWIEQLAEPDDGGAARAHVVGHDWGAPVGHVAGAMAPERVASLTAMAVPPLTRLGRMLRKRPGAVLRADYMLLFQLPGLAERLLLARDGRLARALWRRWSPGWEPPPEELDAVVAMLRRPGVARAALGYYRALADVRSEAGRRSWALLRAPVEVPTLLLYGERDGGMDPGLYRVGVEPADFPAGVELDRIAGAGHFLHRERPEAVGARLLRWLSSTAPSADETSPGSRRERSSARHQASA